MEEHVNVCERGMEGVDTENRKHKGEVDLTENPVPTSGKLNHRG